MRLPTIILAFLISTLCIQNSGFGQSFIWKAGNPGPNENEWLLTNNWALEGFLFAPSSNSPGYATSNDASLIIAGGSALNQRAVFAAPGPGTTSFVRELQIGANTNGQSGYLVVASGTLAIGGNGFLSHSNTSGGDTAVTANRLDITGGQLTIGGASLNLNSTADRFSRLDLTGGTLQVNSFTKSGAGAVAVNLGNGTLLAGTGGASFFSDLSNTTVSFTGNTTINTGANNVTISEAIGGTGGFTKTGTGNLTLSGTNTFSGTTTINDGTVTLGSSNVLANGDINVNGGTLAIGTNSDSVGVVTLTSGAITGSTGV